MTEWPQKQQYTLPAHQLKQLQSTRKKCKSKDLSQNSCIIKQHKLVPLGFNTAQLPYI